MYVDLAGGSELRYQLYGSRPNVFFVREGLVVDAFKDARGVVGRPAPEPSPAHRSIDENDFSERARRSTTAARAITSAFPLFDSVLAAETLFRVGLVDASVEEVLEAAGQVYRSALEVEREVETSEAGRLYQSAGGGITFSLIRLQHLAGYRHTPYEDVDSAVSACTRLTLRRMQYDQEMGPVRQAIDDRLQRAERRLREVSEHARRPGRADQLERYGHLLMASGRGKESGLEAIAVPDHFCAGELVAITLDPSMSVLANAERYYDRARRSRASRQAAQERVALARTELDALQRTAAELEKVTDLDGLREFRRTQENLLGNKGGGADTSSRPFRRYVLGDGFEAWVGRSARENDELTFGHARKFDIWMHARGVGGSHVLLRLPGRDVKPGSSILEASAAIAAYYSKARGSELVPVMYTERKYVRRPRGADAGKVVVEREEVVIVRPALPRS
jgi:predicted ribosome quality control (RQC) complex YloA/Tae2 family protein